MISWLNKKTDKNKEARFKDRANGINKKILEYFINRQSCYQA